MDRDRQAADLPGELDDVRERLRGLADRLDRLGGLDAPAGPEGRVATDRWGPLSPTQERFWWTHQAKPGARFHHCPMGVRLRGHLDVAQLLEAAVQLTARHDALRLQFAVGPDGLPRQRVLAEGAVAPDFELVDLVTETPSRRTERAAEMIRRDLATPFDLAAPPLCRLRLFRFDATDHQLHLSIHHAIGDASAIGVLLRDLGAFYGALAQARLARLPSVDGAWGRSLMRRTGPLGAAGRAEAEAYWLERMAGASQVLELPADRPRPPQPSHHGAVWRFTVPPTTVAALRRLAAARDATLFSALLAGLGIVLHRHSGQDDMVIGTMVSGRRDPEEALIAACLAEVLPLRLRVDAELPIDALLDAARREVEGAIRHINYPFQDLVARLRPHRDPSAPTLFSVLLILQSTLGDVAGAFMPLDASLVEEDEFRQASEYHLYVQARETIAGMVLTIEYNTDLFDETTIARLARSYTKVLSEMARCLSQRVCDIDVLDAEDRRMIFETWNRTDAAIAPVTFPAMFVERALLHPTRTALIDGDRRITYGDLHAAAAALAGRLRAEDIGPGSRVGVYMQRSADAVAAMVGILISGAAYVPLDPAYPPERLVLLVNDSRPDVVVVDDASSSTGATRAVAATPLLRFGGRADAAAPVPAEPIAVRPNDLAYAIYTSGSTGRPKGVAVEHRSLANLVHWAAGYFSADELSGCLSPSSISFDSSVFELFAPLAAGGTVILAPTVFDLPDLPAANEVTFLVTGAPSAVAELLRHRSIPRSVRSVLLAGETVSRELVDRLYDLDHIQTVRNLYGPTEATVYATGGVVPRNDLRTPTIGRPLANVRVYILDAGNRALPVGAVGNLHLAGAGLARGYLDNPTATAERFLPDPFVRGERMYRTGDLARYRSDGEIEFVGRSDQQVKIRGFRIEPGEVEAALLRHPAVAECMVIGYRPSPDSAPLLVAYVVPNGIRVDDADVRRFLRSTLPAHLVPDRLVDIPSLPKNSNGKVDRGALPPPGTPSLSPAATGAPGSTLEAQIAEVWKRVLGVDHVDLDDNFFDIGGHSLLLPQLVDLLEAATAKPLRIADVFTNPTVGALAALLAPPGEPASRDGSCTEDVPESVPPLRAQGALPVRAADLAVIGFACRLPRSPDAGEFWSNLVHSVDCTGPVPHDRPGWQGRHRVQRGGFLEGIDDFEPGFFRLAAHEARAMDPHQRLLLEVAWEAFAQGGYRPADLARGDVGVFVGASPSEHSRLFDAAPPDYLAHRAAGSALSMLANRLSYLFDLRGPSLTIDTACSSSLVALHLARQSLLGGECGAVLVAGVSLLLSADTAESWDEAGLLAPDGRSKSFSDRADGYGASEGVVAVVLKPLAAAEKDADQIWAVLKGTATNHDGRAKIGLTAPNPHAHAEVVAAACRASGISPASIGFVEAHGTGTALGDPLEVAALAEAFQGRAAATCALGSVKSTIGHCGPASGLASVLGAVLALHHGQLPPVRHLTAPNRAVTLEATPFFLNDRRRPWIGPRPRRAAVSCLGFGGANAHAILEEAATPGARQLPAALGHVLTLSARSTAALRALVAEYRDYLVKSPNAELGDIAFTANTGRPALRHRVAIVARSVEQLRERLDLLSELPVMTTILPSEVFVGSADHEADRANAETQLAGLSPAAARAIARWCAARGESVRVDEPVPMPPEDWNALQLALAWQHVAGITIDWSACYRGQSWRRIPLPVYPFERRTLRLATTRHAEGRPPEAARLHQMRWRAAPAAPSVPPSRAARWLLLVEEGDFADALRRGLTAGGHRVVTVASGTRFRDFGDGRFEVGARSRGDFDNLLAALGPERPNEVVHLWGAPSAGDHPAVGELSRRFDHASGSLLRLVTALDRAGWSTKLRVVTVDAQPVNAASGAPDAAGLAALTRVLAVERPQYAPTYVDLDRGLPEALAATLLAECTATSTDVEVAFRNGGRLTPLVVPLGGPAEMDAPLLRPRGVYVITGGTGAVGRKVAIWLANRHGARVTVIGRDRSRLPAGDLPAGIEVEEADVGDLESLRAALDKVRRRYGRIHGVFHLAGETGYGPLGEDWEQAFIPATAAKVRGACVLDELTTDDPLELLVLFSSHAGLVGNVFQAGYSAASRFLDAFATWRTAAGRRTVSIDWGGWRGDGMGGEIAAIAGDDPERNLAVLDAALSSNGDSWLVVDHIDLQPRSQPPRSAGPAPDLDREVEQFLRQLLIRVLDCGEEDLDAERPFLELGVDSLLATRIVDRVNARTGASFPRTLLFDRPTLAQLVPTVAARWPEREWPSAAKTSGVQTRNRSADSGSAPVPPEPMAVIGMAGRFPGARDLAEFWENLRCGTDAVAETPGTRWGANGGPAPYCTAGGFLDPDSFDRAGFRLSAKEADAMDAQQRLLLEVVWEALEDAGYGAGQLAGTATGVFVGAMASQSSRPVAPTAHSLLGTSVALLANRVSYLADLHGPCLTVDTLCSSSLVALHLANRSLRAGECEYALVGAVRAGITLEHYLAACEMGALARRGRCRAFARDADGIVLGEGAGVVLLKPLARAQADGDHVQGLVLGTAVNHGGQASGLTAPRAESQTAVVRAALVDASVTAKTIDFVEAHGTGTALGDPIEISALTAAFGPAVPRQSIAVGSVKTNVGHLEPAAGIASLLKTLLSMRAGELPPTLHLAGVNQEIDFADSPFYVSDRLAPWPDSGPRRAGVSSFGIGGVNAHCVVEGPRDPTPAVAAPPRTELLALSAADDAALRTLARHVAAQLRNEPDLPVADVCYTATVGRRHHARRLTAVLDSTGAMSQALSAFAEGTPSAVMSGAARNQPIGVAFLCSGQGDPSIAVGAELYRTAPAFRRCIDRCGEILDRRLSVPLADLLSGVAAPSPADVQPALFAMELATAELWVAHGVQPDAVLGHSLGELVAACVAGALSLDDALVLVARRGELMAGLPDGGAMAAVIADEGDVRSLLHAHPRVAIAALNGAATVVSGPVDEINQIRALAEAQGMTVHPLALGGAFHSGLMDPVLDGVEQAARACRPRPPSCTWVSTLTGAVMEGTPDATHWRRHARQPVRFEDGLAALATRNIGIYIEIGPGRTLTALGRRLVGAADALWCATFERARDGREAFLLALANVYRHGASITWEEATAGVPRRRVSLRAHTPASSTPNHAPDSPKPAPPVLAPGGPRPSTVATLRSLVGDALGVAPEEVATHVPLLEVGADSLILADASSRIGQAFGVAVSARQMFADLRTLEALASYIDARATEPSAPASPPAPVPPPNTVDWATVPSPPDRTRLDPERPARPAQAAYLRRLIDRYTARTAGSQAFAERHRPVLADSRSVAGFRMSVKDMLYPIVAAESSGARFRDLDGNDYLDVSMGYGVHLFGHNPSFLVDALTEQVSRGIHLGPQAVDAGEVAERLAQLTGLQRVAFCNSGTEAVMLALRVARTVTRRPTIAVFEGSYHGFYDGTLVGRGAEARQPGEAAPAWPGLTPGVAGSVIVLPYGEPEALQIIEEQGERLAAVLVEPVQSRRPGLQPRAFLHELRHLTQQHGTILIFDEVITGFRVHPGGAQAHFGVRADVATYGKVLAGGLPIGVVAGSAYCLDAVDGGAWRFGDASFPSVERTFFATTFGKNPLSLAAARAVLTEIEERGPGLQSGLNATTTQLVARLNHAFAHRRLPLQIEHFSSLFRFAHAGNLDPLYYLLAEQGVYVWEGRNLFLSTEHDESSLDEFVAAVESSVDELVAEGFLMPDEVPSTSGTLATFSQRVALTDGQRRLWIAAQRGAAASVSYNEGVAVTLGGPLDVQALSRALASVVRRHDALRTCFEPTGEWQWVRPHIAVEMSVIDLASEPVPTLGGRVTATITEAVREPFVLDRAPLLRARLLRLAADHHVLVLVVHHSVADGAGFTLALNELGAFYTADTAGSVADLGPPVRLSEFVREWEQRAPQRDEARAWWAQLAGEPKEPLALRGARPRRATSSHRGHHLRGHRGPELANLVRHLAASQGVTPFMLLLAAFGTWLHRLSGQEGIVVGIPHAMPTALNRQPLVAHRVAMLPISMAFHEDDHFATLLQRVALTVMDAIDKGEAPPIDLGGVASTSDASPRPQISVEFNMDPPAVPPSFADLEVSVVSTSAPMSALVLPRGAGTVELESGGTKFDLTLSAELDDSGVTAVLEYAEDLFDDDVAEPLFDSFWSVLEDVVAKPSQSVRRAALVAGEAHRRQIVSWNSTVIPLPSGSVVASVREHATRHGARTAVLHNDVEITYGELTDRMTSLTASLFPTGITGDSVIALDGERNIEFLVAILAVHAAGGAYLPLDPGEPPERLAAMLRRSRPVAFVAPDGLRPSHSAALDRVPADERPLVVGRPEDGAVRMPSNRPPALDDLAYVMFTSGSTGEPKGVMVERRGMMNHLWAKVWALDLTEDDHVVQNAPSGFDVSVWQFLAPLLVGARISIVDDRKAGDPAALLAEVERGATILEVVPAMLRELLDTLEGEGRTLRGTALRWLISTGEPLPPEMCQRWLELHPSVPLMNAYGPTECSDDVCHHVISEPPPPGSLRVPVGRPIPNVRLYVVDDCGSSLPVGLPGEIYVAGVGVGRGYINDEARTKAVFLPDPLAGWFATTPGSGRAYRTGDVARWLPDGTLEHLGRRDGQVKVAGRRVELGEVEAVLERHPAVDEAAVIVRANSGGGDRLVGYVAGRSLDRTSLEAETVEDWGHVFEDLYAAVDGATEDDATRRIWVSSYTSEPLDHDDVAECLDETAARILARAPRRILDVGCGIGLLARRLAAQVDLYCGTDISPAGLTACRRRVEAADCPVIRLVRCPADDLSAVGQDRFDVIVLSEMVQYFPSLSYLDRSLREATSLVKPGGMVFVSGVRSLPLLEAFHGSVARHRLGPFARDDELQQAIAAAIADEQELVVHPAYFRDLVAAMPGVSDVKVWLKTGRRRNEITDYRYDVVITAGVAPLAPAAVAWLGRGAVVSVDGLRTALEGSTGDAIGFPALPNARLICGDGLGLDPADVIELGHQRGWHVEVGWSAATDDGSFDAVFSRVPLTGAIAAPSAGADAGPPVAFTNQPGAGQRRDPIARELRQFLAGHLPAFSIPAEFVVLDRLPRTTSGKVARHRLPPPGRCGRRGPVPRRHDDRLAAQLAELWAQTLDQDDVGDEDNFFELGGDSLLAIRIVRAVDLRFGVRLSLQALFEAPTLGEFVRVVRGAWAVKRSPLVAVQSTGEERPLYLVHPSGGHVMCYAALARHLGPSLPVYGLQSYGLAGDDEPPLRSIEAMAFRYLAAVRGHQPAGPYRLGGWSMGGVVALEMAQQLVAEGESVELLVLLDADARGGPARGRRRDEELLRLFHESLGLPPHHLDAGALTHADREECLRRQLEVVRELKILPDLTLDEFGDLFDVFHANVTALWNYVPAPLAAPLTLFRAEHSSGAGIDPVLGWGAVAAHEVELEVVPGGHFDLLREPNVRELAARMRRRLARA